MNSNMFFVQEDRHLFGQQFGYAIEYWLTQELEEYHIRFAGKLIPAEDPQNVKRPQPTDLVSECIYELAQKKKSDIIAIIYSRRVKFSVEDSMYDIKKQIREIQKSLIKISPEAGQGVKKYFQQAIWNAIKNMPVC